MSLFLKSNLYELALRPREVEGLYGVLTMHFLHSNLGHLISNTIPLLILGIFVSALGKLREVSFLIMILSGLMVWIFARDGLHAGASALVMGYWGYLVSNAFFHRSFKNILITIITLFVYGGAVFTLLDFRASISFEGHIFGFLAGTFSAKYLAQKEITTMRKNMRRT